MTTVKLLEMINQGKSGSLKLSFPALQINVTNKCNLRCVWCYYREDESFANGNLSLDIFKKIIDKNRNSSSSFDVINLTSGGEVFMNKDFYEMASYVKDNYPEKRIWIASNATFSPDNEKIKATYKMLGIINVSIDGATKETFEQIRKPAIFEDVIKNLKKITQIAAGAKIELAMTVSQKNIHEIVDLVRLAHSVGGIESIWIGPAVILNSDMKERIGKEHAFTLSDAEFESIFQEAEGVARELNITLNHADLDIFKNDNQETGSLCSCMYPWLYGPICLEDHVMPCCTMNQDADRRNKIKKRYDFGNPQEISIDEMFNNQSYWNFREDLLLGKTRDLCEGCIYYKFHNNINMSEIRVVQE